MGDNKNASALQAKRVAPKIDKRLYDTIYAEVGGGDPKEVAAVTSVFLNRVDKEGYEKALKGSTAYRKKSKEYIKALTGGMTAYEKQVYLRNKGIVDTLISKPELIAPFTHFENVDAFREPSWAKDMESSTDIGRQRFYKKKVKEKKNVLNNNAVSN